MASSDAALAKAYMSYHVQIYTMDRSVYIPIC